MMRPNEALQLTGYARRYELSGSLRGIGGRSGVSGVRLAGS